MVIEPTQTSTSRLPYSCVTGGYLYNPGDHATSTQLSDNRHPHTVLQRFNTLHSTVYCTTGDRLQDAITAIICDPRKSSLLTSRELSVEILLLPMLVNPGGFRRGFRRVLLFSSRFATKSSRRLRRYHVAAFLSMLP